MPASRPPLLETWRALLEEWQTRDRGEAAGVGMLSREPRLGALLEVWPRAPLRRPAPVEPPDPLLVDAPGWAWLWDAVRPLPLADLARMAGILEIDIEHLVEQAIGLHLLYPDGTTRSCAAGCEG